MDLDASQAGIDVLKRGGNAVDAAVATASALGVTIPFVAGPGGGGFMVIYLAKTHQVVTIDGRENCPAACATTMFLDPKTGQPLDYDYASDQPLATGVPSMVAAWATAVSRYGRKSLAADLQPAIGVAERGFRVNQDFVQLSQSDLPELQAYPASRSLLLTPSGQPLPVGSLLRNPDLAKTYRLLARYGPSYLYDGPLGQAIVQADDHPVLTPGQTVVQLPGIMTTADLRAYQARVLAPTRVRYRGLDIYSMAPPSSSGSTVGEALNILSGYNLSAEPRVTTTWRRRGWPTPTATPTSATPATSACRCPGCSTRRSPRPGAASSVTRHSSPRWRPATRFRPTGPARRRVRSSRPRRAATPTTSSPPTSGATWSRSPTRSTSSAAAARPCPATASCSTTR
jgi:gamma-glutamyltranspeptidase/glutathione hydrolase